MTTTTARFVQLAACAAAALLAVAASGAAAQGVGSVITQAVFNSMLPNRDNSQCPARGFYTYDAFIAAANSFPAFGTSGGSAELIRRELAAFFGQTSHETTGTLLITVCRLILPPFFYHLDLSINRGKLIQVERGVVLTSSSGVTASRRR
jgi:hypothetical protein